MTNPKHKIIEMAELVDAIEIVSTIDCFACQYTGKLNGDGFDSAEYFYAEGWRMFEDQPYCKNCLKRMKK